MLKEDVSGDINFSGEAKTGVKQDGGGEHVLLQ